MIRGKYIRTEEIRKKNSDAHKGIKLSKEHREKISNALKGIPHPWNRHPQSEEHKRKIGEAGKGRHHSEETKRKMGNSRRGIKLSKEHREKLSESHKGQIAWNKGLTKEIDIRVARYAQKIGFTTKNKTYEEIYGIEKAKELKEKRKEARQGKTWKELFGFERAEEVRKKLSNSQLKGGLPITPFRFHIRNSFEYRLWRSDVFTRDDFTCQDCGKRGGNLHAHHRKSFSLVLELNNVRNFKEALECSELWDINNGKTLCEKCHKLTFSC